MTEFVQTDHGVEIAHDRPGRGRPLILVGGAGQFRAVDPATRALATALAGRGFDVVDYDRPGRGESTGEPPFTLAGEVAAVRALVDVLGGRAALYGSSSGGVIALAAAAEIPGIDRLVLWEVPLGEEGGTAEADELDVIRALVEAGDREGALRHFMREMPPEWFAGMRSGPHWPLFERLAPSVQADAEALAWSQSAPRSELWGGIAAPVTVLPGTTAFPFFADAAESIVDAVPHGDRAEVRGADHGWTPADMADVLAAHVG